MVHPNSLFTKLETFQQLIEDFPYPIIVHFRGHIQYINRTGVHLFEANSIHELMGLSLYDLVTPEHRAPLKHLFDSMQFNDHHRTFSEGVLLV